jgi:hypothetical protein
MARKERNDPSKVSPFSASCVALELMVKMNCVWPRGVLLLVLLLLLVLCCSRAQEEEVEIDPEGQTVSSSPSSVQTTCHAWTGASCDWEPNLKAMKLQFQGGTYSETFYAYVTPDVSTFYNETAGTRQEIPPRFTGFFGKFINLSPDIVRVFWRATKRSKPVYISDIEPFGSAGTATFPNHVFLVTPQTEPDNI